MELTKLIDKYVRSIPRYTSYPTAVEFHPRIQSDYWFEHFKEYQSSKRLKGSNFAVGDRDIAIYIHIPFCRSLGYYCACNKIIVKDDSFVKPYIEALRRECAQYEGLYAAGTRVSQFHLGGGTPNFLGCEETSRIFITCKNLLPDFLPDADISVEIDPRTSSVDQIINYRELGFNRISLGVQDFDPEVQTAINRVQSYDQTVEVCEQARRCGFVSINFDLIYGLPRQKTETFQETLRKVLDARPDRIALYSYAHVSWKNKTQKAFEKYSLPDPETKIALFTVALETFLGAGYEYIGMDHFALPDDSLMKAVRSGTISRNFIATPAIKMQM